MSENESAKRLTVRDIEDVQFRRVAYGYDQRVVDVYLDRICDEMVLLQGEIEDLKRQLEYAHAQTRQAEAASGFVASMPNKSDASLMEILETAQRVKEQTIADAEQKAAEIIAQAQAQAEAELGGLEEEREELEDTVEELRSQARDYREEMAEMLRRHQELLDRIDLGDEDA